MDTTDAPQIIEHIHKNVNFTPNDTKWIPSSARFVGMGIHPNAKGALNVYQLNNGDLENIVEGITANGIKCGTFSASSLEERNIGMKFSYIFIICFIESKTNFFLNIISHW